MMQFFVTTERLPAVDDRIEPQRSSASAPPRSPAAGFADCDPEGAEGDVGDAGAGVRASIARAEVAAVA